MKKLSYHSINSLMGKELNPIQRKFMKNNNVNANLELDTNGSAKHIKMSNKLEPFTHGNKPNNNDPCSCGSLRKFKHCCKT